MTRRIWPARIILLSEVAIPPLHAVMIIMVTFPYPSLEYDAATYAITSKQESFFQRCRPDQAIAFIILRLGISRVVEPAWLSLSTPRT
jgi:hypothetical protein